MTITCPTHAVRSWLGIPYATAERYRRPVVAPFDPELPHDQKAPHRSKPGTPLGWKPTTDSAKTV